MHYAPPKPQPSHKLLMRRAETAFLDGEMDDARRMLTAGRTVETTDGIVVVEPPELVAPPADIIIPGRRPIPGDVAARIAEARARLGFGGAFRPVR